MNSTKRADIQPQRERAHPGSGVLGFIRAERKLLQESHVLKEVLSGVLA